MRVVAALLALTLLAGCDAGQTGTPTAPDGAQAGPGESMGAFDYRYAYRLPSDRLKAVLQSNADACDKLGPTRCQIEGMRYSVDDANRTRAVLMLKVDPTIARPYGEAITKSVTGADGVLVNSAVTGTELTTQARSIAVIDRLRDQLKNAQAIAGSDSPNAANAKALAERTQAALDTIAESEAKQGATLATAPMLLTYESSTALTGLGTADANFRNAGQTLENSLARLLIVLGSIGPWLLALLLIIVVLRWIVHGRGGMLPANGNGNGHEQDAHEPHDEPHRDNRNLIQRWFARDEDEPRHEEQQQH
ncbi:hypothetical protein OF829_20380 [Sphingomonas sp. LB-2]|uniref:hypothetical protein n=1 Tax=Sphingomonas caeni TaxID=2984949 RepID=UPI0022324C1A|nr:hypothetical protein [Sphingomonas caeni]MCW3849600.1 hypothetical protein [Sphingomonas caeni]